MKEKKLNILFLASWYPNAESSQAGNFIQQHAQAVSNLVNVCVIHTVSVKNQTEYKVTQEWNDNIYEIIVYYNKIESNTPLLSKYQKSKKQHAAYLYAYKLAIKEFDSFNLVHLNVVYPAGLFALFLYKKYKLPYILTEHWTAFQNTSKQSFSIIEKYFIKKISRNASVICPVSENLKNEMIRFGIKNEYQVIPNVVNSKIFTPNLDQRKSDKVRILHISNLKDEHKNITGILNVIKDLSNIRTDFKITIAGNGDVNKFRMKASDLNITKEFVHFEDEKTPNEVAQLMNEHDLFLLFSNYENLPCVIAESLVMGLPVISTNVGGISEMLNKKNGVLINPKEEAELYKQLNILIDSIHQFNSIEIAHNALHIYGHEHIGKTYYQVYKSILNQ